MSDTPMSDFAFPATARGELTGHQSCYEQCCQLEKLLARALSERDNAVAAAEANHSAKIDAIKRRDEAVKKLAEVTRQLDAERFTTGATHDPV